MNSFLDPATLLKVYSGVWTIAPRLRLEVGLGLWLELGLGAIFDRDNCPRTNYSNNK